MKKTVKTPIRKNLVKKNLVKSAKNPVMVLTLSKLKKILGYMEKHNTRAIICDLEKISPSQFDIISLRSEESGRKLDIYGELKNPIRHTTERKIKHAVELFKKFRGEEPEFIDKVKLPDFGNVAFVIGDLEGVMYRTRRDGKIEHYIHRFDAKSQPVLISNHSGTQIAIIGGAYNFTEDGIVDKKK